MTDFTAASVYGTYNDGASKSLSITISTTKMTEDSLREIEKYECKDCEGDDDIHCATDTGTTSDSISIIFSASADANKKVDADGFPKEDTIEKTGLTDDSSTTISWTSHASEFQTTGTITFAADGRPATATDDFELDVDLTMQGGKKYKAHLKSKIVTFPTAPTAPSCADDQYLNAVYK
jgi:hypothetical protein